MSPLTAPHDFLVRNSTNSFLSLIFLGLSFSSWGQDVPIVQPGAPGQASRDLSAEEAIEIANDTPYGLLNFRNDVLLN